MHQNNFQSVTLTIVLIHLGIGAAHVNHLEFGDDCEVEPYYWSTSKSSDCHWACGERFNYTDFSEDITNYLDNIGVWEKLEESGVIGIWIAIPQILENCTSTNSESTTTSDPPGDHPVVTFHADNDHARDSVRHMNLSYHSSGPSAEILISIKYSKTSSNCSDLEVLEDPVEWEQDISLPAENDDWSCHDEEGTGWTECNIDFGGDSDFVQRIQIELKTFQENDSILIDGIVLEAVGCPTKSTTEKEDEVTPTVTTPTPNPGTTSADVSTTPSESAASHFHTKCNLLPLLIVMAFPFVNRFQ